MQVVPPVQADPHIPQWVLLVCGLTQVVPPPPRQRTWPMGQPMTVLQLPLKHTWFAAQARPHIPQLRLLTASVAQVDPQRV